MNQLAHKLHNRAQRKNRIRRTVNGTSARPRLSVHVSSHHISSQIIDDSKHNTLVYATTVGKKAITGTMTNRAAHVGTEIGKKAKAVKIKKVVFDRNGRLYHGRVKALADAARKEGLEF
jgi:large subunit ribosomal protein L18